MEEITLDDLKKRPHVNLTRLKPGTRLLMETSIDTLFQIVLIEPISKTVSMTGSDSFFKLSPTTKEGIFSEAWLDVEGKGHKLPGCVVQDMHFTVLMSPKYTNTGRDGLYVSHKIKSCLVEGPGWKYEAF